MFTSLSYKRYYYVVRTYQNQSYLTLLDKYFYKLKTKLSIFPYTLKSKFISTSIIIFLVIPILTSRFKIYFYIYVDICIYSLIEGTFKVTSVYPSRTFSRTSSYSMTGSLNPIEVKKLSSMFSILVVFFVVVIVLDRYILNKYSIIIYISIKVTKKVVIGYSSQQNTRIQPSLATYLRNFFQLYSVAIYYGLSKCSI